MAWGPIADMTLIYNHQGWMLHTLSFSLDTNTKYGLLHSTEQRSCSEWHHTVLRSNFIVSGINRFLMFEDLAGPKKGAVCLY